MVQLNISIDMIGAPTVIIEVKPGPRFNWFKMNEAAERYYGFPRVTVGPRIVSRDLDNYEGISPVGIQTRKRLVKEFMLCFTARESVFYETKYQRPDGDYRWGRYTILPMFGDDGEIRQLMLTSVDITELIETRKRLEDSQKQLEEALTKMLSGFLTICAACKKIRHEDEWQPIDQYASEQMDYHDFSHGVCESCAKEFYGDILDP